MLTIGTEFAVPWTLNQRYTSGALPYACAAPLIVTLPQT